jgi:hypothetical protein
MTGKGRPFACRHRIIDIDDFTVELHVPAGIRERADHLLLTTHHRVRTSASAGLPQRRLLTA